jgi:hypothetical protein
MGTNPKEDPVQAIKQVQIPAVEGHARRAVGRRLGRAAPQAIRSLARDADRPRTVLLHLNSAGNALACESALKSAGYSVEDAGSAPGRYGVLLRVGPAPAEVIQHREDHRKLVEVAPNVWTGPVQHDRGCLAPTDR